MRRGAGVGSLVSPRSRHRAGKAPFADAARCLPYGERLPPRSSYGLQSSRAADGQREQPHRYRPAQGKRCKIGCSSFLVCSSAARSFRNLICGARRLGCNGRCA